MGAAPVLIDRVAEPVATARHVVQGRAGADLVEVDAHRLRRIEGAGDRAVADSWQPQIVLHSLFVPAHRTYVRITRGRRGRGPGPMLRAPGPALPRSRAGPGVSLRRLLN